MLNFFYTINCLLKIFTVLSDNSDEDKKKRIRNHSDESTSRKSSTIEFKSESILENPLELEDSVIITKRFFHDD